MRLLEEVKKQSQAEMDQGICSSLSRAYALLKKGETAEAMEQLKASKEKHPNCLIAARIEEKFREDFTVRRGSRDEDKYSIDTDRYPPLRLWVSVGIFTRTAF